jgi:hypothetical protein
MNTGKDSMTNFDQRLRDAGISPEDVETQIQSPDTALLLTSRELILVDGERLQRGRLRDITGVKIVKTGELNVRSAAETLIEGNVLGFERTERKMFFDAVKDATARAKASVTGAAMPAPSLLDNMPPPPSYSNAPAVTSTADDWRALTAAAAANNAADTPMKSAAAEEFPVPFPDAEQKAFSEWDDPVEAVVPQASQAQSLGDADPWASAKQTFEVEPEKSSGQADGAHFTPSSSGDLQSASSHNMSSESSSAAADSGWNDPFEHAPSDANALNLAADNRAMPAAVSTNNDWGGDTLNASSALGMEKSDMERKVSIITNDNTPTLLAVSRWLKIMAALFFLSGAAFTATLFPQGNSSPLGYFVLLAALFASILFSLMAWGLSELLSAFAANAQDMRAIRRATLGQIRAARFLFSAACAF